MSRLNVPRGYNHVEGSDVKTPCVRCGSTEKLELHHWAPKHLFGEIRAEEYPKSFLCHTCHLEWHNKVTPNWQFYNSAKGKVVLVEKVNVRGKTYAINNNW